MAVYNNVGIYYRDLYFITDWDDDGIHELRTLEASGFTPKAVFLKKYDREYLAKWLEPARLRYDSNNLLVGLYTDYFNFPSWGDYGSRIDPNTLLTDYYHSYYQSDGPYPGGGTAAYPFYMVASETFPETTEDKTYAIKLVNGKITFIEE